MPLKLWCALAVVQWEPRDGLWGNLEARQRKKCCQKEEAKVEKEK